MMSHRSNVSYNTNDTTGYSLKYTIRIILLYTSDWISSVKVDIYRSHAIVRYVHFDEIQFMNSFFIPNWINRPTSLHNKHFWWLVREFIEYEDLILHIENSIFNFIECHFIDENIVIKYTFGVVCTPTQKEVTFFSFRWFRWFACNHWRRRWQCVG